MPSGIREGIMIGKTFYNGLPNIKEVERSHRDNGHLFILQESGTTHIEIDFEIHHIQAPSVVYINPSQIHRLIEFESAITSSLIITSENLQPEYLKLLEELAPVKAVILDQETLNTMAGAASLCVQLSERKQEKLYDSILKISCNTLVALVVSQYLAQSKSAEKNTRFELISNAFRSALEDNFATMKSPMAYAQQLNISTPYLNQCVKGATGQSVSCHIQQRVILEAKRLLYHSNKSVKQIAVELGYEDYSYFTRLFVKNTGMTPLLFRNKNFD